MLSLTALQEQLAGHRLAKVGDAVHSAQRGLLVQLAQDTSPIAAVEGVGYVDLEQCASDILVRQRVLQIFLFPYVQAQANTSVTNNT